MTVPSRIFAIAFVSFLMASATILSAQDEPGEPIFIPSPGDEGGFHPESALPSSAQAVKNPFRIAVTMFLLAPERTCLELLPRLKAGAAPASGAPPEPENSQFHPVEQRLLSVVSTYCENVTAVAGARIDPDGTFTADEPKWRVSTDAKLQAIEGLTILFATDPTAANDLLRRLLGDQPKP